MKHVTILGLDGSSGTMITGPLDIFYLAGRLWNHIFGQDHTPYFEVEIVNLDGNPIQCDGNVSILPHRKITEKAYATINTIEDLCEQIGIGRRSLERRFKAATGDTPLKYLHRLRVEAAKRIIETKSCSFDEIAYQVGYENSSFFRKVFTDLCHISPKTYQTKWGKVNFPDSHFQVQASN